MRFALLLLLAVCVCLIEAKKHKDDSDEDWSGEKHYKKDKYNKHDKYNKYNKYNKHDKYKYGGKQERHEKFDSDESLEDDFNDFPPRNDERFHNDKFYEKEFKHYKYNKQYDDDSREDGRRGYKKDKHHQKQDRHYDNYRPDANFFDEAIQFSKRRLFSTAEDDDHFFDDVKHYNQRQQQQGGWHQQHQPQRHHYQPQPSQYPPQPHYNSYYKQQRQPEEVAQYQEYAKPSERYPGGEGKYNEHGPNTKYHWKHDREDFPRMRPLSIPPPERTMRDYVPTADQPEPPSPNEAAKMARYIVHNADWTTVATISTLPHIRHYPFVNVLSLSDGPVEKGSGIPYLYMTDLDFTPHDLTVNRKCSLSMTLAETDYCKQQSLDPEDPRCAHVTITGEMWKLKNGSQAAQLAEEALFTRHPVMKKWPKDHNFFFATLKMEQIVLLDYFGGAKYVDVKEYLRVTPST